MNRYTQAAQARERFIAGHRPPHGRAVRALRLAAILTTVLTLWALSYVFCNEWLAPMLVGAS